MLKAISEESLGDYVKSTLQPGEIPVHITKRHWIIFVGPCMIAFFFTIILILPGLAMIFNAKTLGDGVGCLFFGFLGFLFFLLMPYIDYKTSEFVITDRRVIMKCGFIFKKTHEIFVKKIESVGVEQSLFGSWLNYGKVTLQGTGSSASFFKKIDRPIEFRNAIQQVQSETGNG